MYIGSVIIHGSNQPGTFKLTPVQNGNGDTIITVERLGLHEQPLEKIGVYTLTPDVSSSIPARLIHFAVEGFVGSAGDVDSFARLLDGLRAFEY